MDPCTSQAEAQKELLQSISTVTNASPSDKEENEGGKKKFCSYFYFPIGTEECNRR